ncbi:MAG: MBL fold metallo-hydrolase, partial [Streptomycetaceae bacterium]|nr:MBL fold metallo-hydrolase [Streptomycetaceae bacterium]
MRLVSSGRHHAAFEFGDLQVVALRDGYIDMPTTRLRDACGCVLGELPAAVPLVDGNLRLSVNAFHVTDGTRSVLIDTGASDNWHDPTMGLIYEALDEAGIDRA